jgi:hypothetical protein
MQAQSDQEERQRRMQHESLGTSSSRTTAPAVDLPSEGNAQMSLASIIVSDLRRSVYKPAESTLPTHQDQQAISPPQPASHPQHTLPELSIDSREESRRREANARRAMLPLGSEAPAPTTSRPQSSALSPLHTPTHIISNPQASTVDPFSPPADVRMRPSSPTNPVPAPSSSIPGRHSRSNSNVEVAGSPRQSLAAPKGSTPTATPARLVTISKLPE